MLCRIKRYVRGKLGQVSLYFIGIMVLMVVLAFIVINIGKIGKDKTYADNAADGGALAAATVMATCFNYVADAAGKDEGDQFHEAQEYREYEGVRTPNNGRAPAAKQRDAIDLAKSEFVALSGAPLPEVRVDRYQNRKRDRLGTEETAKQQEELTAQQQQQNDSYSQIHRTVQSDQQGDCDYYTEALVMGYKYNFYNAGIFHRLGRINQKRFGQFLEGINCGTVQNGMPLTFFWVDGAGRIHTVTAIIEIEPANNFIVKTHQGTYSGMMNNLMGKMTSFLSAIANAAVALSHHLKALNPTQYPVKEPLGDASNAVGRIQAMNAQNAQNRHAADVAGWRSNIYTSDQANPNDIVENIQDIVHSQTVYSANFQFHMGGIVKGMRGDVDILGPTFYPPVQSGAIASFNCKQTGEIDAEKGNSSSFEACLIMTW